MTEYSFQEIRLKIVWENGGQFVWGLSYDVLMDCFSAWYRMNGDVLMDRFSAWYRMNGGVLMDRFSAWYRMNGGVLMDCFSAWYRMNGDVLMDCFSAWYRMNGDVLMDCFSAWYRMNGDVLMDCFSAWYRMNGFHWLAFSYAYCWYKPFSQWLIKHGSMKKYTVECRYNAVQYSMIVHTLLQWPDAEFNHSMNPQNTSHTSP